MNREEFPGPIPLSIQIVKSLEGREMVTIIPVRFPVIDDIRVIEAINWFCDLCSGKDEENV